MTPRAGSASSIIPIVDARALEARKTPLRPSALSPAGPGSGRADDGAPVDTRGRPLHDLRISVTDRCNFRCTYCMPKDVFDRDHAYLPHEQLLTFEEITRLTAAFITQGVRKIRLTGGEPLLRKGIEHLVAQLAVLRTPDGLPLDLTMTTNGSLLRKKANVLRASGLQRLTVSLDALDDTRFRAMNDVDFPVASVLDGIDAAAAAGFESIKINMVVKRGVNDDQVEAMARRFRGTRHVLRFIEFMDVGASNQWVADAVVPSAELVDRIARIHPIEPVEAAYRGEVADRWRYRDGSGEVGFVSSVTQPFCSDCSRARLSPEGRLYTCLFAVTGVDLRAPLRSWKDDRAIAAWLGDVWSRRDDRYSEQRGAPTAASGERIEMSYIGG